MLQTEMPSDLSSFMAVLVYIHKDLDPTAEKAFISYTKAGGKLIILHHSISSHKRKYEEWFHFLAVELPKAEASEGGAIHMKEI